MAQSGTTPAPKDAVREPTTNHAEQKEMYEPAARRNQPKHEQEEEALVLTVPCTGWEVWGAAAGGQSHPRKDHVRSRTPTPARSR